MAGHKRRSVLSVDKTSLVQLLRSLRIGDTKLQNKRTSMNNLQNFHKSEIHTLSVALEAPSPPSEARVWVEHKK